jgi:hypothetical protein
VDEEDGRGGGEGQSRFEVGVRIILAIKIESRTSRRVRLLARRNLLEVLEAFGAIVLVHCPATPSSVFSNIFACSERD